VQTAHSRKRGALLRIASFIDLTKKESERG